MKGVSPPSLVRSYLYMRVHNPVSLRPGCLMKLVSRFILCTPDTAYFVCNLATQTAAQLSNGCSPQMAGRLRHFTEEKFTEMAFPTLLINARKYSQFSPFTALKPQNWTCFDTRTVQGVRV